jgi:hypothetical protein
MANRIVRAVLSRNATDKIVENILKVMDEALLCHQIVFHMAANRAVDNPQQTFLLLVREMFDDNRMIHWGRIAVVFALAFLFQERFGVNLESETLLVLEVPLNELVCKRSRLVDDLKWYINSFFFL